MTNRRGIQGPPVPQIWCNSNYYLQSYRILENWHTLFLLIGRHLKSVSRTKLVFELNLAPSEERVTYEFCSSLSILIELPCEHCKLQPLCQGKVKGHIELKIEETLPWENRSSYFKFGSCTSFTFMGYGRQNGTVFDNWPPSWMCHTDRTGCWTRVSPNQKEAISVISAHFYHMPERYERVRVGWHCAKVKGHAELK